MTSPKPSLMIITDEFDFTNTEVNFIRKNFQKKYPSAMNNFIDSVRELMKTVQTSSIEKLVYSAFRYYPEGSSRYHISESLSSVGKDKENVFISLQPVESDRKAIFGANGKNQDEVLLGVGNIINDLEQITRLNESPYNISKTHNGLLMSFVVSEVLEFLKKVKNEIVVQSKYISIGNTSLLNIEISHRSSRSHYLSICFDFCKS
jgi:hypothetical protein